MMWHGDVVWCQEVTELKAGLLIRRTEEFLLVQSLTFLILKNFYIRKNLYGTIIINFIKYTVVDQKYYGSDFNHTV